MVLSTECSKCKAAMPNLAQALMYGSKMAITGYRCSECGHWNNLKRRKWFRAHLTKHAPEVVESAASISIPTASEVSASEADSSPATTQVM